MKQKEFIEYARSLLGTKFVHQGRSVHGLDCIGLVVLCADHVGVDISADYTNYSRIPHGLLMPVMQENLIAVDEWEPADVLLMKFKNEPMHVGIWTGDTLIHTYSVLGKVVEHSLDEKWKRRIVQAYRIKEFA